MTAETLRQHILSLQNELQTAVDKDYDHHAVILMDQIDILNNRIKAMETANANSIHN